MGCVNSKTQRPENPGAQPLTASRTSRALHSTAPQHAAQQLSHVSALSTMYGERSVPIPPTASTTQTIVSSGSAGNSKVFTDHGLSRNNVANDHTPMNASTDEMSDTSILFQRSRATPMTSSVNQTPGPLSNYETPIDFLLTDELALLTFTAYRAFSTGIGMLEFPRLCFQNRIGQGASFEVRLADRPEERFAVKIIRKLSQERQKEQLRSVILELRVLTHPPIRNHRNIVKLSAIGWKPDDSDPNLRWPYLVMEYADQGTLHDLQKRSPSLTYNVRKQLCLDVAEGLDALHKCGIIHGDVKAENTLIFTDGQHGYVAKLGDFGYSILENERQQSLIGGTHPWTAPETKNSMPREQWKCTDIYSYGLLVWRCLLDGKSPFDILNLPGNPDMKRESIQRIKESDELVQLASNTLSTANNDDIRGSVQTLRKVLQSTLRAAPGDRDISKAISAFKGNEFLRSSTNPGTASDLTLELKWSSAYAPITDLGQIGHGVVQRQFVRSLERFGDVMRAQHLLHGFGATMDPSMSHILAAYAVCEYYLFRNECGDSDVREDARKWLAAAAQGNGVIAIDNYSYIHKALNLEVRPPERGNYVFEYEDWRSVRLQFGSFRALEEINQFPDERRLHIIERLRTNWCSGIGQKFDIDTKKLVELDKLKAAIQQAKSEGVGSIDHIVINNRKDSLLHCLSVWGALDCIRYLIGEGANLNCQNNRGETPLLQATRAGQHEAVELLLSYGADAQISSMDNENGLHWIGSIEEPHQRDVATKLFRAGVALNGIAERVGGSGHLGFLKGTPLHRCIHRKQEFAVRVLLELGADPFIASPGIISAVNLAAGLNLYKILPDLLASGHRRATYSPDELDEFQHSAPWYVLRLLDTSERMYYHASEYRYARTQILSILAADGATMQIADSQSGYSGLEVAVQNGDLASVEHLVSNTLCALTEDILLTSLEIAVRQDFKRIFSFLINHRRSNINRDALSRCLCLAAETADEIHFARELLACGVAPDARNYANETPFFIAVRQGFFKLANFLLQNGASNDIYMGNSRILAQMLLCAAKLPISRFKYLIETYGALSASAFIVIPSFNCSVYHCMAANLETISSPAATRSLMAYFLSIFSKERQLNVVNAEGDTALQCAIKHANAEVAIALITAGADINSPGGDLGISPLDMAKIWLIHTPHTIIQESRKIIAVNRRANLHDIISTLMSHNAKTNDDWVQDEDPVFLAAIKDELAPLLESGRTKNSEYLQECLSILCKYFDPMAMSSLFGLDIRLSHLAQAIQAMFNGEVSVEITRRPPKMGIPGNMAVLELKNQLASVSNRREEDDISKMTVEERMERALQAVRMGWEPPGSPVTSLGDPEMARHLQSLINPVIASMRFAHAP